MMDLFEYITEQQAVMAASAIAVISVSVISYMLTRNPFRRDPSVVHSREIGNGVRISNICATEELLDEPYDNIRTLYDAFMRGYKISKDKNCVGYRDGSIYNWLSYEQLRYRVQCFGSGLLASGIDPDKNKHIGVIGINCIDWVVAQLGASFNRIVVVPMYDTLGDEAVRHILQQTECELVVAHPQKVAKVQKFLSSGAHNVRIVVKMCEQPTAKEEAECKNLDVQLMSVSDMEKLGKSNLKEFSPPKGEDLYTICYTSGTTGIPKGAMISHENMAYTMAGVMKSNKDFILDPTDVHYSYLPLCHLFEMSVHIFVYTAGASIGFYSGSPAEIPADLKLLKPSIFPAVPRVLNKFKERIEKTIAEKGSLASWIFNRGLISKYADLNNGIMRKSIWDALIFNKIKEGFGGRISLIATGAAPILPETLNFFRAVFGANVYEGYGQTESTAGCTFTIPADYTGGHVGPPLPTNYIKLVDSDETGHFVSEGKGEVCIKGKNVFSGYYRDLENTKNALDRDGWLHTGDIGEWNKLGCLRIIDRKKYIFKTSLGEYIAPEKIENVYELHNLVYQMFIDGNSRKPVIAAVMIPDEENLLKWAADKGKGKMTFKQLIEDPDVNSEILHEINTFVSRKLMKFELVAKLRLVDQQMSIENDLLTPTFKKKRPSLKRHFSQSFDIMYGEME